MADWSVQETRCLLGIWGDADVQCKLDGVVRNKIIYELIARELEMLGYERTWQQKNFGRICVIRTVDYVQRLNNELLE